MNIWCEGGPYEGEQYLEVVMRLHWKQGCYVRTRRERGGLRIYKYVPFYGDTPNNFVRKP